MYKKNNKLYLINTNILLIKVNIIVCYKKNENEIIENLKYILESCNLIKAKSQSEFAHMCFVISEELINHFKDYIVSINLIKKLKKPYNHIEFNIGVSGYSESVTIKVPYCMEEKLN